VLNIHVQIITLQLYREYVIMSFVVITIPCNHIDNTICDSLDKLDKLSIRIYDNS
jgi:glutathione peroxidase-family protein